MRVTFSRARRVGPAVAAAPEEPAERGTPRSRGSQIHPGKSASPGPRAAAEVAEPEQRPEQPQHAS